MLTGSALKNKGVQPMLDAVIDFLPSPLDVPAVTGIDPKTDDEVTREADPIGPVLGPGVQDRDRSARRQAHLHPRLLRHARSPVPACSIRRKGDTERISRMVLMHANDREEIKEISAGNICAVIGLKNTFTGDTLCDPSAPVVLESITFPEPVISVSVEPKTKADQDKMGGALAKLAEEDPTFRVRTREDTGQTVIDGMGELHLAIIVDRMMREFRVEANVGRPQVAYRETITVPVKVEGRHVRQSGGKGQYGHCVVQFEPQERGAGYEFVDGTVGGSVPREYVPSVNAGIREALETGGPAGFPMVDVKATLWTARTTMLTRRKWHSRSPVRWH